VRDGHSHGNAAAKVEIRNAAMQCCGMTTTLAINKRGGLTLPPALRRKLGLEGVDNPLVIVEEREGGLFLQPAAAIPVRDITQAQLARWISRDEAEMKAFARKPRENPKQ
jgi:bifunctional DNA-binding transcriptional regulator/antitoxin component of YhaV-PrlF toxin-antitoxin module